MLKVRYDSCHIVTCFSVGKMTHMEQELIKRHNIKMMNEMQEVVRQIKQAKTKNDEILRDYHKKQTDLTRSVLEIAEKFATMRSELDEMKRQAVINKQQLTHRCDQNTEQVAQLKHAVFTAWQKEKTEIQQKVRGDLALVLGQFDAKLKENFAETSKLRYEIKRLTARMNGEDPDSVAYEHPSYTDTTVPDIAGGGTDDITSGPPPGLSSAPAATSTAPPTTGTPAGVNLSSLTQNLAAFIARQQAAQGGSATGPPQVNVQMLQQFMQTLPRQQQLQLQMLLQQHRAANGQTPPVTASSVTPAATTPVATPAPTAAASGAAPPGLSSPTRLPAAGGSTSGAPNTTAAATMIQSLAQQLQLQVNTAQQKASSSGPGTVNCPYFSMFGWCKFGERCRYIHNPTGKEPLRNLPQSVIQTLQNQLASGSTDLTTQTLMTALAGVAARQQQSCIPAPPGLQAPQSTAATGTGMNTVQQAMIQAQIQAQQEAAQMGATRAKQLPCRFFAIGRCAYGDRCGYNHSITGGNTPPASGTDWTSLPASGGDTSSTVAAAAAAAWGKTGLQQASWGGVVPQSSSASGEEQLIMDGEDDTSYDQWNSMTFELDDSAPPPGL
jgi:hypothetical protein